VGGTFSGIGGAGKGPGRATRGEGARLGRRPVRPGTESPGSGGYSSEPRRAHGTARRRGKGIGSPVSSLTP
jgi:hypothetical protein